MRGSTTTIPVLTQEHATTTGLRRRSASWGWDYLVALAWLVLVAAAVGIPPAIGWLDLSWIWSRPVATDVAVTVLTVLPYLAYLTLTEAGPAQASWGKRRVGLHPQDRDDPEGPVSFTRVLVRNTLKVLPWQLGQMSAMRLATPEPPTAFAVLLFVASVAALGAIVLPVLVGRTGAHDLMARTRISRMTASAAAIEDDSANSSARSREARRAG